jgi:hypothetical protein
MEALAEATGLPLADIERAYQDWERIEDDTGWLLIKGTEVHVCAKSGCEGRVVTRRKIREVLGPVFKRFGMLTTRTMKDDPATFVRRMGFKKSWSDGVFDYYVLTALPFSKEN